MKKIKMFKFNDVNSTRISDSLIRGYFTREHSVGYRQIILLKKTNREILVYNADEEYLLKDLEMLDSHYDIINNTEVDKLDMLS